MVPITSGVMARGVGFIGINMHRVCITAVYADDDVAKDERTSVCLNGDLYDLLILHAELLGALLRQVDMPLGGDNAFLELNRTLRSNQGAARAACEVAGLADRDAQADAARIGQRDFDLRLLAYGPRITTFLISFSDP